MNQRNISYIGRYNSRRLFPLVDDKLKTKLIAQQAGATVPELIGVIHNQADVPSIHEMVAKWPGFVIKPPGVQGVRESWLLPPTEMAFTANLQARKSVSKT